MDNNIISHTVYNIIDKIECFQKEYENKINNTYMDKSIIAEEKKINKENELYNMHYPTLAKFSCYEDELKYENKNKKKCRICNIEKYLIDFQNNTSGRQPFNCDGYRLKRGECKECQKEEGKGKREAVKLAKEMGLSYKAPEGTPCELCGTINKIVFDHCHSSKIFRGWLCDPCNRSCGVLGDNVNSLLKVVNYMNKNEKKNIKINDGLLYVEEN